MPLPGLLRRLITRKRGREKARPLFLIGAFVATLPLILAAQDAQTIERGEQILNERCSTTCHDLRPVDVQALDEAGWTKAIASMIEKGAKVSAEERPVLRDYLVKSHGPLPDGPGKQVLLNTCTLCHDLQRVRRQRNSTEGWAETLEAMLSEGAPLSAEDLPVLLRYLARNFGPE